LFSARRATNLESAREKGQNAQRMTWSEWQDSNLRPLRPERKWQSRSSTKTVQFAGRLTTVIAICSRGFGGQSVVKLRPCRNQRKADDPLIKSLVFSLSFQTLACKLEVSVKETSICIVDDTGKIVREMKVASEPDALLAVLKNLAYHFKRVGLEAGPLSQWLYSGH
jgi:hypothetical protein